MKLKILIVDDEHSGRVSLNIFLKKEFDFLIDKIITASSLDEAILFARKEPFNICFLDIQLNNKSGFDLLPHLPTETKVIFVTTPNTIINAKLKTYLFWLVISLFLNQQRIVIKLSIADNTHNKDSALTLMIFSPKVSIKSNGTSCK